MDRYYILTRFNLKLWGKDKHNQPTNTEKWLKRRFELFEAYCLPSVKMQKHDEFKWFVLFDETTPQEYIQRFPDYKKLCPQFVPIRVRGEYGTYFSNIFQHLIIKDIQKIKENKETVDNIITIYLDNDDAISEDFLSVISAKLRQISTTTFITFCHGLQYNEELQLCVKVKYSSNHFITLVEKYTGDDHIKTVFGFGSHTHVFKHDIPVLRIDDKKSIGWLEIVHEANIFNNIIVRRIPHLYQHKDCILEKFHVNLKLTDKPYRVFYGIFLLNYISETWKYYKNRIVKDMV